MQVQREREREREQRKTKSKREREGGDKETEGEKEGYVEVYANAPSGLFELLCNLGVYKKTKKIEAGPSVYPNLLCQQCLCEEALDN